MRKLYRNVNPLCPKHGTPLRATPTKYGLRYACREKCCTVVWWENGSTSTPADETTRKARMEAHKAFDAIWKQGFVTRNKAYEALAIHMDMKQAACHIGMMNSRQCITVVEFAKAYFRSTQQCADSEQQSNPSGDDLTG